MFACLSRRISSYAFETGAGSAPVGTDWAGVAADAGGGATSVAGAVMGAAGAGAIGAPADVSEFG
ncbi:MAG TPA: hypothetical protein VIE39_01065, partial [Thermoanaerobaculia bacterium]